MLVYFQIGPHEPWVSLSHLQVLVRLCQPCAGGFVLLGPDRAGSLAWSWTTRGGSSGRALLTRVQVGQGKTDHPGWGGARSCPTGCQEVGGVQTEVIRHSQLRNMKAKDGIFLSYSLQYKEKTRTQSLCEEAPGLLFGILSAAARSGGRACFLLHTYIITKPLVAVVVVLPT